MRCLSIAIAAVVSACLVTTASAERRVALVIGNSAYTATSPLPNPKLDAKSMATALEEVGFETTYAARKLAAWTAITAVLAGVFALYTRPDMMVALGDMIWACFR